MILSVSGFGFSGASGFIDLLKEYEEVQVFNQQFEFQLIKAPDGLMDLYHFLVEKNNPLSSNVAIKRFIKMLECNNYFSPCKNKKKFFKKAAFEFINDLNSVMWRGRSTFDPYDVRPLLQKPPFSAVSKVLQKVFHVSLMRLFPLRYYAHVNGDSFVNLTDKYIRKLIRLFGYDDNKLVVLDQFFDACDPIQSTIFVKDWKMLIIDRDPRDIYLLSNYYYGSNSSFMPIKCGIDNFVNYHLFTRNCVFQDDRILRCSFEDLIFNYLDTVNSIENWLNIHNHSCKKQYFNPNKSIANVGIFIKDKTHEKEIKEIENRLNLFCYNFTKDDIDFILTNYNKKIFI